MKREEVIEIAKVGGMKASFGKTTDGKYAPNVNALGSSIPVEWLEAAFNEVERRTIEWSANVIDLTVGKMIKAGYSRAEIDVAVAIREEFRALANQQEKPNNG